MKCVFIINNMFFRPTFCVEINFVGLTSIKCTQSTFPGDAHTFICICNFMCFLLSAQWLLFVRYINILLSLLLLFMCIVVRSQFLEIDSSMMNFSVMHPCNNFWLLYFWVISKTFWYPLVHYVHNFSFLWQVVFGFTSLHGYYKPVANLPSPAMREFLLFEVSA